jgi:diguanylate cyclase (GGDEF)-like protein
MRHLAVRAKAYREEGRPRRLTGVCWDVTERHQAGEKLRATNEKLEQSVLTLERHKEQSNHLSEMADLLQACSSSTEAYRIIGQFGAHLFPNQAGALYIYGASRNLVNKVATWNDPLLDEASFEPDDCWALRRGQPHIIEPGHFAAPCRHLQNARGGHACLPLMAQGTGLGIMYLQGRQNADPQMTAEFLNPEDRQLASNVAEQVALSLANLRLQEALRLQTIRDPLTGLFNRRYLEETVERELHRMTRREQPAGFVMMDLDHFKAFNDTFGHDGGDALLRAFGQFLREHLRREDIACRYGGEEFCVLYCEASLEDTVRLAEQLRSQVKRLTVQHEGQHLGAVTISIGIASYPMHGSTISELIAVADTALYQAKTEGRDQIVTGAAKSTASATAEA